MARPKRQLAGQLLVCKRETVSSSTFRHAASTWSFLTLRSLHALPIGRSLLRSIPVASSPSTGPWFRQPLTEPSPAHNDKLMTCTGRVIGRAAGSVIRRRRTIYWHTADLSAWGAHRRAI